MQLFPRSTSLYRKKKKLISENLHRHHLRASCMANLTTHGTRARWGVTNLSVGLEKDLRCSKISVHPHAPWNKDTCTPQSCALFFACIPFCSSHLLWSKAFPVHLLSPVRWLSNNSRYLVNRWESELNLFSKSLCFGLSTVNSASGKPSWKAYVSRDRATESGSGSTWYYMKEKFHTFIYYSQTNLWSEAELSSKSLRVLTSVSGQ